MSEYKQLDYSLADAAARSNYTHDLIKVLPQTMLRNPAYLEKMSNYIISAMTPEEKKQKFILTDNRKITIDKHETSLENALSAFETNEDNFWQVALAEPDKNILFTHKKEITKQDLEKIKDLRDLQESIAALEKMVNAATGKKKYKLKKWLIEMRQEQYLIKDLLNPTIGSGSTSSGKGLRNVTRVDLDEKITIDENGEPVSSCLISLFNPKHIAALLANYSALKEDCWDVFTSDFWYLMQDLDELIEITLKDKYPLYYKLLIHKIDGRTNAEIQALLLDEFKTTYTVEYLSSLWCKKIPKLIAETAKKEYLIWHYTFEEYGKWKRCSRCGQMKLAHNKFFSKNNTSKDGFYSLCKDCRNAKNKKGV